MRARCADGGVTDSLLASPAFFGALAGVLGGVHCATLTERVQLGPGRRARRRGLASRRRPRRVLTLTMRWIYAETLYSDDGATLDDLCEAVTTLAEIEGTARRVLGGAQPITQGIERTLRHAQAALAVGDAEA